MESAPLMPPAVALLGQSERAEFAPVHAGLAAARLEPSWSGPASCDLTAAGFADLRIVCQSWPDEFSPAEVRRIVTASATSRLICVYGAWCMSDGRTRSLWPQAVRVPVTEFASRLQLELDVITGRAIPLPLTAARDECFAVRCRR